MAFTVLLCSLILLYFGWSRVKDTTIEVGTSLHQLQLLSSIEESRLDRSEDIQRRLQEKRQQFLKAVMTVWSATTEVYLLLGFLVQNWFAFGDLMQLPNFLTCAAANLVFKELRKPEVPLTPQCMQRFTLIMTGATLVFTVGLPREVLPAGYIARITICALSGDAVFATKVNAVMGPLFVLSHFLQADPDPSRVYSRLMFMIVNELIAISLMSMAVSTLDSKEYQIELAALQLEEKVKQLKEAEVSGYAAKRLLSVTCDAIVRLTDDLRVAEPGRSLADLLMCGLGFKNNSLEGVSFLRYVAPQDHVRLRDFITESSKDDTTPRSLNLQLRDSNGIAFDSEIFHVSVPGLTDQREHLVGITQASADRPIENRDMDEFKDFNETQNDSVSELWPQADMRHILGYTLQCKNGSLKQAATSGSKDSGSSGTSKQYVRLRSLDRVNCVVRQAGESLSLRSLKLTFKEDSDAVPDLLQWIKPACRKQFSAWVQAHINAAVGQRAKQASLSEIRMFSPTATAGTMIVGDSRVVAIEDRRVKDEPDAKKKGLLLNVEMRHLLAR